mmetsp:Transcript_98180/g.165371  ORF Transcript_98180/g.165371 Transcript_98180/m.165371 type:complete len:87 (+) Transcript_98180:470-730(+)
MAPKSYPSPLPTSAMEQCPAVATVTCLLKDRRCHHFNNEEKRTRCLPGIGWKATASCYKDLTGQQPAVEGQSSCLNRPRLTANRHH